jgi:hypothetical protein
MRLSETGKEIKKEALVAYCDVLSPHLPETAKKTTYLQSGYRL